jgi:hypothetical protein
MNDHKSMAPWRDAREAHSHKNRKGMSRPAYGRKICIWPHGHIISIGFVVLGGMKETMSLLLACHRCVVHQTGLTAERALSTMQDSQCNDENDGSCTHDNGWSCKTRKDRDMCFCFTYADNESHAIESSIA